jgi:hypothetical protein
LILVRLSSYRWAFNENVQGENMKVLGVLAVIMASLMAVQTATAGSLKWTIRSDYPHIVSLEFYSQDYSRAWPGDGQVYIVDDYDTREYSLSCETGETICYGAWVRGDENKYWGTGMNNSQRCNDCCYTCGHGDTDLRILN